MTADQLELRLERRAIMMTEGETEEAVQGVFKAYPWLYGYEDKTELQGELI